MTYTYTLPADGFFQIAPLGEFPYFSRVEQLPKAAQAALAKDADADGFVSIVEVIDRVSAASILAQGATDALVDYEHDSAHPDRPTVAAGWLGDLVARDDGVYAKIRWSKRGEETVTGGEYRYISPNFAAGEEIEWLGGNRFRIQRITGAGLTNLPNLRTLAPLTNKLSHPVKNKKTMNEELKKIAEALGLAAEATLDDIISALTQIKKDTEALEAEVLENRKKEADALCDAQSITDTTKRKELSDLYLQNRELVKTVFSTLPIANKTVAEPLSKRFPPQPPARSPNAPQGEVTAALANKISERARILRASDKKLTLAQAYAFAEAEVSA